MIIIDVNFMAGILSDVGSMIAGLSPILEVIFALHFAFFILNKFVRMVKMM